MYFEESGKQEDRDLISYAKVLKAEGMPFAGEGAAAYRSLPPEEFLRLLQKIHRLLKSLS